MLFLQDIKKKKNIDSVWNFCCASKVGHCRAVVSAPDFYAKGTGLNPDSSGIISVLEHAPLTLFVCMIIKWWIRHTGGGILSGNPPAVCIPG